MNTLGNLGWWASGVILLIKCWTHWLTLSFRLLILQASPGTYIMLQNLHRPDHDHHTSLNMLHYFEPQHKDRHELNKNT